MTATQPNVLWVTTHDLGRHLGCYGLRHGASPNLDQLASEGVCFERFFATNPICSPSRGSLITGCYPQRNGLEELVNRGGRLRPGQKTAEDYFKSAGYRTALIGHQHERPKVDDFKCDVTWGGTSREDKQAVKITPVVCETLRQFANEGSPFYLRTGFYEAHRPLLQEAVDETMPVENLPFLEPSRELTNQLRQYQQLVARLDRCFGEIRNTLRETGLDQNTMVLFTTDHGIPFPRAKGTLYDSGLGIAALLYHPRLACGGKRVSQQFSGIDLLPTLLDLAGIRVSGDNFDGLSFKECLSSDNPTGREFVFGHRAPPGPRRSVRTGRFNYIVNFDEVCHYKFVDIEIVKTSLLGTLPKALLKTQPMEELYDLEADPSELVNVATNPEYATTLAEMRAALKGWMENINDPLLAEGMKTAYFEKARNTLFRNQPPAMPVPWQ